MAHHKSPRRRAKLHRIAALHAMAPADRSKLPLPAEVLARLEETLLGPIVLPGDPEYDADRQEHDHAFQEYPEIIVYCQIPQDVALCLAVARDHQLWIAIRSGGHSTAGYSVNSGMVIDVGGLADKSLDPVNNTLKVGPGVDFDTLNKFLDGTGLHVPTGACGSVRVGGFMQGGGFGYTSRNFGMNSDCVTAVEVMLWDGSTVRATGDNEYADLFWAVRGGTGGNFGVVVSVTYQLVPLGNVWAFAIQWDVSQAAAVLLELERNYCRTGAPQALGYMMNVGFTGGNAVALIQGMFCGSAAAGKQAVASLLAINSAELLVDISGSYAAMNDYLDNNPYPIPNPPQPEMEDKICGYVAGGVDLAGWQAIVDQFLQSPTQYNALYTEAYGGAINAYPLEASAFIHRNVDMNLVIDAYWTNDAEKAAAEAWLFGFEQLRGTYFSNGVYQNYPRRSYETFREDYWGIAFDRLLQVKRKYDPNNVFRYQQSISPYPTAA